MLLQALLYDGGTSYTATFLVYSADGLAQYEDATSYFDIYIASIPNSPTHYLNAKLKSLSPAMCSHPCFIIRLIVQNAGGQYVFDKYTERYCQSTCCDVPRGITSSQDSLSTSGDDSPVNPDSPKQPSRPTTDCGNPLIRIISQFSCKDLFSGNYYGDPATVYSGSATFNYTKISSIQGRIVRRPADIQRTISYNCKLQRSESFVPYLLEGYDMLPAWKMAEIEGQLHADHIWVDDYVVYKEYQFAGGVNFAKVQGALGCDEVFKLSTTLQDCTIRQTFGCDTCEVLNNYFLIPNGYSGDGWFYDENGQFIASVYDGEGSSPFVLGLLDWLRNQQGITGVTDIDVSGFDCEIYALVQITSNGGYVPTTLYYDSPTARNRIFLLRLEDVTDICGYTGNNPCAKPVNDTVIISDFVCNTPVNDTVIITEVTPTDLTITDYGAWIIDGGGTTASVYAGQVSMDIKSVNTTTITGVAGETVYLTNEVIGVISADGRPDTSVLLNEANGLPADVFMVVNSNGTIMFTGATILTDDNEATIEYTGLVYNTQ